MLILLITWKIGRYEIVWWYEIITLTKIIWTLLSFVKISKNSVYTVHDNNGMKLVTCLKLDFNHLKQDQLKHSFQDTIYPMCSCGSEPETAVHSPLDCQNHKVIIIINSFIVSRGWFLTYIYSTFGSTSFGLTSLFLNPFMPKSIYLQCFFCFVIYFFCTFSGLSGKRNRFHQGLSLVFYLHFRIFILVLLNCQFLQIWSMYIKTYRQKTQKSKVHCLGRIIFKVCRYSFRVFLKSHFNFRELLLKNGFFTIHHKNFKQLRAEVFMNVKGESPAIINGNFQIRWKRFIY